MFSLKTRSPKSSSGSCSASEMVSRASQVGPKTEQISRGAALEGLQMILAVVEDDAGERVVDAVVDVVAAFAVAEGLADHLGDRRCRRWPPGTAPARPGSRCASGKSRSNSALSVLARSSKGLDVLIVGGGKAAADVQQVQLSKPRSRASWKIARGQVQGLHEVLEVGGLAADVEAQPLDDQAGVGGGSIRSTASPGAAPNFDDSSTMAPVLGTWIRSTSPACGRVLAAPSRSPPGCRRSPAACSGPTP